MFCCCTNRCGLKQRIQNRIQNRDHLSNLYPPRDRTNYTVNDPRANDQLLLDLTQNPAGPTAETSFNRNYQDAGQSGARIVQNTPIIKNQAPAAPVLNSDNCYCAKDSDPECRGGGQQPPPYSN